MAEPTPPDAPEPLYTIPEAVREGRRLATALHKWVRGQPWGSSHTPPPNRKALCDAAAALVAEVDRLAAEQMAEVPPAAK